VLRRRDVNKLEKCSALIGQRVQRHLPVTPVVHEPGRAQRLQVMRDQVLSALDDPGEITDAKLWRTAERERDVQPCRIAERW